MAQDWINYRNERYGFSLQYPGGMFVSERKAEAGDGEVFAAQEKNARLLVGALVNESGYAPANYVDYIARHSYADYQIAYKRVGSNWFALSGEGNGKIFYEKVVFSCGDHLINSFAMIYPSDQRNVFDPIVERIEKTFRPGQHCQHAGLPVATTQRKAETPRPFVTLR
jgi:hypothetical protein